MYPMHRRASKESVDDVVPIDRDRAARRPEKTREDAERRALASAVRPEEAEDLALADLERDVVHRDVRAVALRQVGDADHAGLVPRGPVRAKPIRPRESPRIVSKLTIGCSPSTNAALRSWSVSPPASMLRRLGRARARRLHAQRARARARARPCFRGPPPPCVRTRDRVRVRARVRACARARTASAPAPGSTPAPALPDMLLVPAGRLHHGRRQPAAKRTSTPRTP